MNKSGKPINANTDQQVPLAQRFFWSLGAFSLGIAGNISVLVNQIYINALHYDPNLVNLAKSVPLFAGMVTNPMIGHFSDNTRSRWGRRKPWMLVGLVVTVVGGLLFWNMPKSDGNWNWWAFIFLAFMIFLVGNIGGGTYGTAHGAMGFEMTTNYNERTQLFKWSSYMGAIAGVVGPWLLPLCMWLEGPVVSQEAKGSQGVFFVSVGIGVIILLTGLPSILFCRETTHDHRGEKKVPFLSAVKMTLHNKPFWLLVVSNFIMSFARNVTGFFFFFLLIYYVGQGDQTLGANSRAVMYNTISVASFIATAPIAMLTDRIGKKAALLLTLAMSALAYASLGLTFTTVEGAYITIQGITFQWPCLISAVFIGVFTNTMPMIQSSMLADVCDYDELKFGNRREAFYGSVFGFTENIAMGVSLALQGILLVMSGFDSNLTQQSDQTMQYWLVAVVVSQPLGFLLGIFSICFYPLSRARMLEIRSEIDARKIAGDGASPGA